MKPAGIPLNPTPRMLRQFAAGWIVLFAALALYQVFELGHRPRGVLLGAIACAGFPGLMWPRSVKWLFIGATIVTFPIGWALSPLILALIFYLVITPIGLVLRWRGRDELQLRRDPERGSFWVEQGDPPEPEKYLKQF